MPISFSLIARLPGPGTSGEPVVLAECSAVDANFQEIARQILRKASDIPSKKTFTAQNYMFHVQNERGVTFLCVADADMGHRIPYAFLNDLKDRFFASNTDWQSAKELGLNSKFHAMLSERMSFFSYDPESDKITKVKGEVTKAKSVMMENIDKVIQRGESIEVLVDKTERLDVSSQSFKVKSKALERKMCCKNAKMCAILIAVAAALFIVILFIILWKVGAFDPKNGGPAPPVTTVPATTAATVAPGTTILTTTLQTAAPTTVTTDAPTTITTDAPTTILTTSSTTQAI